MTDEVCGVGVSPSCSGLQTNLDVPVCLKEAERERDSVRRVYRSDTSVHMWGYCIFAATFNGGEQLSQEWHSASSPVPLCKRGEGGR